MDYLRWPLDKHEINQRFGENPKVYLPMGLKGHDGIDFKTRFIDSPLGHREVVAARDGVIETLRDDKSRGYGLHIRIRHENQSLTIYGHLSNVAVAVGQQVVEGQVIGITGNSGFSTGPHLHFEYRPPSADSNNGYAGAVDPWPLLINYQLMESQNAVEKANEDKELDGAYALLEGVMHRTNGDVPVSRDEVARLFLRFATKFGIKKE